ncbi:MAG: WbqC family protein [Desulfobacula sp.]|nr:WbqC family protein [Desulfobacula sp.]
MNCVCIHQPDFLPYLGFFHRLLFTDIFIILDDVQFLRKGSGWHNRDKIKTKYGAKWLSLSVMKGKMRQNINEVNLAVNSDWTTTNLNLLKENYIKSPYFNTYFPKIRDIYLTDFVRMMDMNMAFLEFFFELFELRVNKVFSSDLNVDGHKNQRVINLVKAVGSIHYLSGIGARDYLDEEMFADEGITVEWQKFNHPVYPQLHGEFIPNLSCIDLLFNCGPNSKDILWSCKEVK